MYSLFKDLSPEEKKNISSTLFELLSDREAKVISLRLGINSDHQHTLEEIATKFNVTPERIRQIEAKAVRKLRHPSRTRFLKKCEEGHQATLDKNTLNGNAGQNSPLIEHSNYNQADRVKEKSEMRQENVTDRIEKLTEALHNQGMPYKEIKNLFSLSPQQLENIKAMTSMEELLGYAKIMNPFQYLGGKADTGAVISALERIAYGSTHKEESIMDDAVKTAIQRLETKQAIETKQKQKPFVIVGLIVLFVIAFTIHPGFLALVFLIAVYFIALWASGEYHI